MHDIEFENIKAYKQALHRGAEGGGIAVNCQFIRSKYDLNPSSFSRKIGVCMSSV